MLGRRSVVWIALEFDRCTILPRSAGGQSFELRSTQRLLTCHSLACDTRGRARPWSVECARGCWHMPLCTYIVATSNWLGDCQVILSESISHHHHHHCYWSRYFAVFTPNLRNSLQPNCERLRVLLFFAGNWKHTCSVCDCCHSQ